MDTFTKSPAANAGLFPTISQTILRWIAVGLWMWLIWIFGSKDFAARETFSIMHFIINFFLPGWPDANPETMRLLHIINIKITHFLYYGFHLVSFGLEKLERLVERFGEKAGKKCLINFY